MCSRPKNTQKKKKKKRVDQCSLGRKKYRRSRSQWPGAAHLCGVERFRRTGGGFRARHHAEVPRSQLAHLFWGWIGKVDIRLHGKENSKLLWRKAGRPSHLVDVMDSDQ